jgi:hypothetical protein
MEMFRAILVSIASGQVETVKTKLEDYTDHADTIVNKVLGGTQVEVFIDSWDKCTLFKTNLETNGAATVQVKKKE